MKTRFEPRRSLIWVVLLGFGIAGPVAGQTAPEGAEFQINDYVLFTQEEAAVAVAAGGDFVVAWVSLALTSGDDGSSRSIRARLYAANGTPLAGEFLVNTYTTDGQTYPAVATGPGGEFVVVWQSEGSSGDDSDGGSVQAQRYAASGTPLAGEFQVNTYTTGEQGHPAVAMSSNGDLVVVWQSSSTTSSIQAQLYDADGIPLGSEFQAASSSGRASVAMDADGGFVVVWGGGGNIQGQLFTADGTALAPFQVNTYTTNGQSYPAVGMSPDGDFAVVWESFGSDGTDSAGKSIQGQRFAADGMPLAVEFQVNTYTSGDQEKSTVAMDSEGAFVVAWHSYGSIASDSDSASIQVQRYAFDGAPVGAQFQVNTHTAGNQRRSAVATHPGGDFVVVWDSEGSTGSDQSQTSVQGQRYRVTGRVGDLVWLDENLNGVQNGGEPGLEGVLVHLYDSPFSNLRASTTTDAQGLYEFRAKAGEYFLQFELPSTQSFTNRDRGGNDSLDSDADTSSGQTDTFIVAVNDDLPTWDAGMANGIGDRVWLDVNGDGLQNGGELGMAGVEVRLFTSLAVLQDTTTTTPDGKYGFVGLGADDYYLEVIPPAGFALTTRDVGGDDTIDSDFFVATGTTAIFSFDLGTLDRSRDAGLVQVVTETPLFADGFESGNTSAWSSSAP